MNKRNVQFECITQEIVTNYVIIDKRVDIMNVTGGQNKVSQLLLSCK